MIRWPPGRDNRLDPQEGIGENDRWWRSGGRKAATTQRQGEVWAMSGQSAVVTLLEDWRARRERLAERAVPAAPYVRLQIQILDYLVDRYRDAPEAARPARCPARPDLYVNDRAIAVHNHLWEGKVGGAKSQQEAHERVSSILKRMTPQRDIEPAAADDIEPEDRQEAPEPGRPVRLSLWELFKSDLLSARAKELVRRITPFRRRGRAEGARQESLLLPKAAIDHLYRCLADPNRDEPEAVDRLARCANESMLTCAALAWRERVAAGRQDATTRKLRELFLRADLRDEAIEKIGALLADRNAWVRLEATVVFGQIGSLEHVGLLSDLLLLPRSEDEDPREREALVQAMQSISQRDEPD
jgi:hypothetical protein